MNTSPSSRSPNLNRRVFLQGCAVTLGAGLAAKLPASAWAQPTGANGDIRVGVVGVGRKGSAHLRALAFPWPRTP